MGIPNDGFIKATCRVPRLSPAQAGSDSAGYAENALLATV